MARPAAPRAAAAIAGPVDATRSQTLHRGLSLLSLVAEAPTPLTLPDLVVAAGLHRSVVYRLVRTLEDHGLVERTDDDRYVVGLGLLALGRFVGGDLRSVATPLLHDLADRLAMTAFLVVRSGDEAVTLVSVEPSTADSHVTYRPGSRHPVDRGAPGLALLAAGPPRPGERPEVADARRDGWVRTSGEVLPGLSCVASPVRRAGGTAAVCVVFAGSSDDDALAEAVAAAAARLTDRPA